MISQPIKQFGWTDIPYDVDVSVGDTWGTIEEVKEVISPESSGLSVTLASG